jgi:uncharacterized protein (TIGR03905 family)
MLKNIYKFMGVLSVIYKTQGVCSREIEFEIEGKIVKKVEFKSGCPGNLEGISKLVEGMEVDEIIKKLSGIRCGGKQTSCPDQLAKALRQL